MTGHAQGRVLIIAGSDSSGGAGIQADIKTVTTLGGYAASAVTAITAQNTLGVQAVEGLSPAMVGRQMTAVLEDIGADAVKTGMLYSTDIIKAVADTLAGAGFTGHLVLDPVMVATSGDPLMAEGAVTAFREKLIPRASLVTPNLAEASVITGRPVDDLQAMREAAVAILEMGAAAVLVKGGHLKGDTLHDLLVDGKGEQLFTDQRIDSRHTHGTGCTLASAIACKLACGQELSEAVCEARSYVRDAIRHAPGFGKGHGPLGHNWLPWGQS